MHKLLTLVLAVAVILSLVVVGCAKPAPAPAPAPTPSPAPGPTPAPTPAPAPAPLELRFAHGWSTKHHVHPVIEAWTKEVEEATEGRVKITIYPGATIAKGPDLYDAAATGVADMAWSLQGYTPGKFPLTSVMELPFMATSSVQGTRVMQGLYEKFPEVEAEYEGVKILWLWALDPGQLLTTKKQVRTLDDISGMKLRTASATLGLMMEELGAVPVHMGSAELYDALQKGVVDGGILGVSALKTFSLQDVIRYVTVGNFFVDTMFVVANDKSWNKISASDQKIIEDLNRKYEGIVANSFVTEQQKGFEAAEAAGAEEYILPAAELDKWKQAVSGISKKWIADMESKGLPGQEVYDAAIELAEEYK